MCDGIPWQKSSITLLTEGLFFFKTYLGQEWVLIYTILKCFVSAEYRTVIRNQIP
jgi:hypothetical protein